MYISDQQRPSTACMDVQFICAKPSYKYSKSRVERKTGVSQMVVFPQT